MNYYDRIEASHRRLLAQYGQGNVEIGRTTTTPGATEFDPPTTSTVFEPLRAVVQGVGLEYADGSSVRSSDLTVQCGVPSIAPDLGNKLRIDGGPFLSVTQVDPVPAAGNPVGYILIVSRG
ncbi:hypothetical protein [Litoreibacter albidus]|uniref:hypothetical protein n=1 Tax=Litoreibacter albidus TaxID=670155 RepID=UPI003734D9A0